MVPCSNGIVVFRSMTCTWGLLGILIHLFVNRNNRVARGAKGHFPDSFMYSTAWHNLSFRVSKPKIYLINPWLVGEKGKPIITPDADGALHFLAYFGFRKTCPFRFTENAAPTPSSQLSFLRACSLTLCSYLLSCGHPDLPLLVLNTFCTSVPPHPYYIS
jgi:hypothetical protein